MTEDIGVGQGWVRGGGWRQNPTPLPPTALTRQGATTSKLSTGIFNIVKQPPPPQQKRKNLLQWMGALVPNTRNNVQIENNCSWYLLFSTVRFFRCESSNK
eukprot:TRINITY_DN10435_c0_g2_i10.p6 TRINITY_DN10435_c0_g2~~TRINITY_DN10435_c0_g2_i10.p6  ORF type:complete len:108 (-),score=9.13 TRINITY_DN10435_c0_g2_i10:1757-2059(-)